MTGGGDPRAWESINMARAGERLEHARWGRKQYALLLLALAPWIAIAVFALVARG